MTRYSIALALVAFAWASWGQNPVGGLRGTSEPFVLPDQVDSLFYWFAADQGILDSLGNPITDGAGVATWPNLSNRANDLEKTTTPRPIWKATEGPGGMPVVRFNNNNVLEKDSSYWSSDNITIFIVMRYQGDLAAYHNYLVRLSPVQFTVAGNTSTFGSRTEIALCATVGSFPYDYFAPKSSSYQTLYLEFESAVNISAGYVNGKNQTRPVNSTQSGILDAYAGLRLGAGVGLQPVDVSEVIIYSDTITSEQRIGIENYLKKKYKL